MKGKGLALLLAACMLLTGCAGKTGQTAPSADDTPQRTETAVPPQTEREKEKTGTTDFPPLSADGWRIRRGCDG